MTDENANTADLTDSEKLDAILRRLAALEAASDDRARETRPKLDTLIAEVASLRADMVEVRKDLRAIDRALTTFSRELMDMKTDLRDFDERLTEVERRPN